MGVSFSADGIHWERYEGNPVIRGYDRGDVITAAKLREATFPEDIPGLPRARVRAVSEGASAAGAVQAALVCDVYVGGRLWGAIPSRNGRSRSWCWRRTCAMTRWQRSGLAAAKSILLLDHPEDHRCEFYGVVVFRSGDTFLGLIWIYDASYEFSRFGSGNQYAIVDVQLAASRDLLHWERLGGPAAGDRAGRPGGVRQPYDLLPFVPADGGGRVVGVLRGVQ